MDIFASEVTHQGQTYLLKWVTNLGKQECGLLSL